MGLCEAGATSAQGLGGDDVSPGHPKSVMSFQELSPAYPWNCLDMALQILSIQSHSLAPKFISRSEITENQTTKNPFVGSHSLKPLRPGSYEITRGKNILFFFFPQRISLQIEGCAGQTLHLAVPGGQGAWGAQTLSSLETGMGPSEVGLNLPLGRHSWAGTDPHFLQADHRAPLPKNLLSPLRHLFFLCGCPHRSCS